MEIIYLKDLQRNPTRDGFTNEGIQLPQIEALEQTYNNAHPFPKALRELLYLAGDYCIILDYGLDENQNELQEFVRENLQEENKSIQRPFFAIDVYNAYDTFLFVYLDEGDNPPVYVGIYSDNMTINQNGWVRKINNSLSDYIGINVQSVKKGFNPF